MTKSEERKIIKANQRKLYLGTWAKEKARGVSLSSFCKSYGLSRKNFYIWLKNENITKNSVLPIQRADPKLKAKAIEIYLRYKGTWCAETISMALKGMLSATTIRKIIVPHRCMMNFTACRTKRESRMLKTAELPNIVWSVDWTEFKIRGKKFFILLFMDEASRFYLGWYIFNAPPTGNDVTDCLRDILERYEARPFIIKSDRAKVFSCAQWLGLLAENGITAHRIRPHCPQDQGVIERGMREIKTWLRANKPACEELSACLDEGMFMLNFLKPKMVLNTATPAAVY
ncbi:MAG: hypothetical protein A2X34_04535, partial [Elusimicrobia bacterium GWC2_51_8]